MIVRRLLSRSVTRNAGTDRLQQELAVARIIEHGATLVQLPCCNQPTCEQPGPNHTFEADRAD